MRKVIIITVFLFGTSLIAQDINSFFEKADYFFETYVLEGKVAYSKIKADPKNLNELLEIAQGIAISVDQANEYQAFWINAYNLAVIKGVVNNYPIRSPLDIPGFFDKVNYDIGGLKITLNDIENTLLRAKFMDARFHFVLVCGAMGCPPLIDRAYVPNLLEQQLNTQTKGALNGNFLKVNTKKKSVTGSEILKWYKEDFTRNGTSEIDYINTYRTEKIPSEYRLSYFTYDWNLNKQ